MEVSRLTTCATAAVRDAENGHELIVHAEARGLDVTLLSGEEEARISGQGVLSGIPDADGIVGHLGGGSLALVRVAGGELCDRASFPLGVLRLAAIRERGDPTLERSVGKMLKRRSEEHTSELPSLMRISYSCFCLIKKSLSTHQTTTSHKIHS